MSEIKMIPHYWTKDVEAAIKFYTEVLGFELSNRMPEDGKAIWCEMKLNGSVIMFAAVSGESEDPDMKRLTELVTKRLDSPSALTMYYKVDDVDQHYENAMKHDVDVVMPLKDQWWGFREYTMLDMDGNLLSFNKEVEK